MDTGDSQTFTSLWARLMMAGALSMPALATALGYWTTTGMAPWVPPLVCAMSAVAIAVLWPRHGRVVLARDRVILFHWGLGHSIDHSRIDGYVWRAMQSRTPLGDGIVFVAIDPDNGIGLRGLCQPMSASYLLAPDDEERLVREIVESIPGIRYFQTPPQWRRRSNSLAPVRDGGEAPPIRPPAR